MKLTKKEFEKILKDKVVSECGVTLDVASAEQIYRCMAMIVRQIMSDRQKQFQAKTLGEGKKQVYYLCMEFLMGRSLRTSLFNLGLNEVAESVLADADVKIDTIYEQEPDAGLGNGGLGRLAACYLDSMTTLEIPATGYSICYELGIFKQKIVEGQQVELPDDWMQLGDAWLLPKLQEAEDPAADVWCDSAARGMILYYQEQGIGAQKSLKQGLNAPKSRIRWMQNLTRIVIDPDRCPLAAKEFPEYEYVSNGQGDITETLPKVNDDAIDAAGYAAGLWIRSNL